MLFIHTDREGGYVCWSGEEAEKSDYNRYFILCCDGGSVFAVAVRSGVYTGQMLLYVCTKGNTGGDKGKRRTFPRRPCAWLAADGAVFNDYGWRVYLWQLERHYKGVYLLAILSEVFECRGF